jgi:hypothetical protein
VVKADWTYQVAPAGSDSAGLEEYVVEASSGEQVGKVMTLLRRGDEMLVAVERGTPPLSHDVRVFPWEDVESVDHTRLTVRLAVAEGDIERALELDPDKGVEDERADAVRVTELPGELRRPASPTEPGPTDRPLTGLAIALGVLGVFSLLGAVIAAAGIDSGWKFALFLVPAVLLIAAGVVSYRLFRSPYER